MPKNLMNEFGEEITQEKLTEITRKIRKLSKMQIDELWYLCEFIIKGHPLNLKALRESDIKNIKKSLNSAKKIVLNLLMETSVNGVEVNLEKVKKQKITNKIPQIKLLSISKNKHRSEYSFPKVQEFFGVIRSLLPLLGFEEDGYIVGFGRPWDEEMEAPIWDKEDNILNYSEQINHFVNKKYSVDIVFFSKTIHLIFNYRDDRQQEISKALDNFIVD